MMMMKMILMMMMMVITLIIIIIIIIIINNNNNKAVQYNARSEITEHGWLCTKPSVHDSLGLQLQRTKPVSVRIVFFHCCKYKSIHGEPLVQSDTVLSALGEQKYNTSLKGRLWIHRHDRFQSNKNSNWNIYKLVHAATCQLVSY